MSLLASICSICEQPPLRTITQWRRAKEGGEVYEPYITCARCAAQKNLFLPAFLLDSDSKENKYKCGHDVYLPSGCVRDQNPCCTGCRSRIKNDTCERCLEVKPDLRPFKHSDLYQFANRDKTLNRKYTENVCRDCYEHLARFASYCKRINATIGRAHLFAQLADQNERAFTEYDLYYECVSKIANPEILDTLKKIDREAATAYLTDVVFTTNADLYRKNGKEDQSPDPEVKQSDDLNDEEKDPFEFSDNAQTRMPWSRSGNAWPFQLLALKKLEELKPLPKTERSIWEQRVFGGKKFNPKKDEQRIEAFDADGNRIPKSTVHRMYLKADTILQPLVKQWFDEWTAITSQQVLCGDGTKRVINLNKYGTIKTGRHIDEFTPSGVAKNPTIAEKPPTREELKAAEHQSKQTKIQLKIKQLENTMIADEMCICNENCRFVLRPVPGAIVFPRRLECTEHGYQNYRFAVQQMETETADFDFLTSKAANNFSALEVVYA